MKKRNYAWGLLLMCCLAAAAGAQPAFAQGMEHYHMRFSFAPFSPFLALIAGILILIFPRVLNYIVAIYLIIIGLAGIFIR